LLLRLAALALGAREVAEAPVACDAALLRGARVETRTVRRRVIDTARIGDGADADEREHELREPEEALHLGRRGEHGATVSRVS
jgi:hypothetical protein